MKLRFVQRGIKSYVTISLGGGNSISSIGNRKWPTGNTSKPIDDSVPLM